MVLNEGFRGNGKGFARVLRAPVLRQWGFLVCVASVVAFLAFAATAQADAVAVDGIVKAEMARTQTPGVIVGIVGADAKPATRAYGLANVELMAPVGDETVFQSGSIGKQFTAAAVMLLVEDGKIKLDAPITSYFKGAPAWWGKVTVRHLLTHTSGLPDYAPSFDVQRAHSEETLARHFFTMKPMFAPGARWAYSNPGYVLLGIIVRKASGQFYGDLLKTRVFAPAGMTTARVISEADIVPNRAAGYRSVDGALKNQEWVSPEMNTTADGSLYLTVLDLVAWDKALRARSLLKPESWAQVWTPVKLNSGRNYPYGFGWFIEDVRGEPVERHTGSWQGFKTAIARYTSRGLSVIVLANHAAFDSGEVAAKVAGAVDAAVAPVELAPIADGEPQVTMRLKALLAKGAAGKLRARDFRHMPSTWLPADGYASLLKPLGPLQRLDLLKRREVGDDRVYRYNAVFASQTLRVDFAIAPDDGIAVFIIESLRGPLGP